MSFKTLHITNAWHSTSGGISTFYRALLDAANREGHLLRLIVPAERTYTEPVGAFGKVYHLAAPRAPLNASYRILYPTRFLWPRTAIHQILHCEQPDLVEICDKYSLPYLSGLLRIQRLPGLALRPTVVGLSCERMDENFAAYLMPGHVGRWFSRAYMKCIYFPQFDHHIAVSEHVAQELRPASRGHKVQRGVWPGAMGVDIERFSPAFRSLQIRRSLEQRCHATPDSVLMLFAGRLVPEKNLPLLLTTLLELRSGGAHRDYRLLVAGQGILLDQFRRACEQQAPGAVTFLGHLKERDELAQVYANCDLFLHPNPREPFGIALLEAMASGLPVAAPDAGGILSFACSQNSWLAPPRASAMADAARAATVDCDTRQQKLKAARETAEHHAWPAVTARFFTIYRELHALRLNANCQVSQPLFYSTRGNLLGIEI